MQKRICLSEHEVQRFYRDRSRAACPDFGWRAPGAHRGCSTIDPDGECALCKRLRDFWKQIKEEE